MGHSAWRVGLVGKLVLRKSAHSKYHHLAVLFLAGWLVASTTMVGAQTFGDSLVPLREPTWLVLQQSEQDRERGGPDRQDRTGGDLWRRFWRRADENEHSRNHRTVREAFRSVVHGAVSSTVQIFCGNRRVAYGTVVDSNGYILTKASELKTDAECECALADGRRLPAKLVTVEPSLDVAVLWVDAFDLQPVVWRTDDVPPPGSWLATVSTTDVPLAVGVVSTNVRSIPKPRAIIGVLLEDAPEGALIRNVIPGSPASEAGLKENDIIVEVNGAKVQGREALVDKLRDMQPGDEVTLGVLRDKERLEVTAKLAQADEVGADRSRLQNSLGGPLSQRRWGFPQVLEHDSVVRPSECGTPVVDLSGRAVGINIARAGRVVTYALPYAVLQPLLRNIQSGQYGPAGGLSEKERLARAAELQERFKELSHQVEELVQKIKDLKAMAENGSNEAQQELLRLEESKLQLQKQLEEMAQKLQKFQGSQGQAAEVSIKQ